MKNIFFRLFIILVISFIASNAYATFVYETGLFEEAMEKYETWLTFNITLAMFILSPFLIIYFYHLKLRNKGSTLARIIIFVFFTISIFSLPLFLYFKLFPENQHYVSTINNYTYIIIALKMKSFSLIYLTTLIIMKIKNFGYPKERYMVLGTFLIFFLAPYVLRQF